jgi:hypothetical protein
MGIPRLHKKGKIMIAYNGDKKVKSKILKQLLAHAKADEIIKGKYWEGGKGCAVGCTIHSSDHAEYEPRFGVPQMLARLEDRIFEGLPNAEAKQWPIKFMSAIAPGADLSRVGWKFQYWLLTAEKLNPGINHPLVRDAVKKCADVLIPLTKGQPVDGPAAWSAESAARSAARSAESAAESAAWSARSAESAAESAAWSARSAESAAESAAWSAESAARSAARSAESAAESAESAESAAWSLMAQKLLELIRAEK